MRSKYIADFAENDAISEVFLIENKSLLTTRGGKPYINLDLRDRTGTIPAKVWDDAEEIFRQLGPSQFAEIAGTVESYQNKLQLKVRSIKAIKAGNIDMSDFMAVTEKDVDVMFDEISALCSTVRNRYLKTLLRTFLDDKCFTARLKSSPAAKIIHHAWIGGLLEHTLSVMQICDKLVGHFGEMNRDLVLTGAFFHDMGKIHEIVTEHGFGYTREGNLVGHVVMGYAMVDKAIAGIEGFPDKLRVELGHLILSHQGKLEFGAPVVPMCAEAILLHYVDDLDVRINVFRRVVESSANADSEFLERIWPLESRAYTGIDTDSAD